MLISRYAVTYVNAFAESYESDLSNGAFEPMNCTKIGVSPSFS